MVYVTHFSVEKSRSGFDPTTHPTTLSILRNQSLSLVALLSAAVQYQPQLGREWGF